jgi:superoxide dismutase, Fe-Mn family
MNELTKNDLPSCKTNLKKHQLLPLTYGYDALSPYIDEHTLFLHHDIHHGGYVDKLNKALEKAPEFLDASALWLLCNLDKLPKETRVAVHHNAGGHVNHSLFWRAMRPDAPAGPKGLFRDAINRDFGSVEEFKVRFDEVGENLFGSGWVWLVWAPKDDGKLEVVTTYGHDNPMMKGQFPLLLNDVWEHAYYLHYESRRPDYLKAWWSVVDWEEASRRFDLSSNSTEELWEAEGGVLPVI